MTAADRPTQDGNDRVTLSDVSDASFLRPETSLRLVGLLRPIVGRSTEQIAFDSQRLVIGRDPATPPGDRAAVLEDDSVSRQHAEIVREHDEFVLHDLDSSNGTYVDGVPIVSCVLRDGDAIQIGRTRFFFHRLYELPDGRGGESV